MNKITTESQEHHRPEIRTDDVPASTGETGMDDLLHSLFAGNLIDLIRGPIFDRVPPSLDLDALRSDERVAGMLLGLAVGDALGFPTEFTHTAQTRRSAFGTIRDHEDNPAGLRGNISDDTQLSFWTLERLLALGRFDLDDLARCLVERRARVAGIGGTVAFGLGEHEKRLRDGTPPVHRCPGPGRGDGTLMRYAPLLLPHLRAPSPGLWRDVTLASFLTHGSTVPLSATVAFAHLLWEVLRRPCGGRAPPPEWWLNEYVAIAGQIERPPAGPFHHSGPIPALHGNFHGGLCAFVDREVRAAWRRGVPLRDAVSLDGFGSASDCLQSVPAALYVLMSHAGNFEEAVVAAANDTQDNDSIASIVGALLGALHGRKAIPPRWLDGIVSSSVAPPDADREIIERRAAEAVERFV
jgi:ADP-ribosylglycohydrolase